MKKHAHSYLRLDGLRQHHGISRGASATTSLPDQIHILNVSFLVSATAARQFGGCAGNIRLYLKLLEAIR